ncbi:hypothetical protein ABZ856_49730, partial [Streptomyces sp. NPDC047009]
CARAATAQEAAFRIDYPLAAARNTRVVALDHTAEQIVHRTSQMQWAQARFYSTIDPGHNLLTMTGETVPLTEQLKGRAPSRSTDGSSSISPPLPIAGCRRSPGSVITGFSKDPRVGPWAARYLQECLPVREFGDVPVAEQTADTASARILEFLRSDG